MNKLNILLATESFYPDGWGGAHTYVYNLAKYLSKTDDFSPVVLTIRTDLNSPKSQIIEGVKVFRYNSYLKGKFVVLKRPILSVINAYRTFKKLLKEIKFDILNFHAILPAFSLIFFAKVKDIPKIYTFHSSLYEDVRLQAKKKKYLPSCLNFLIFNIIHYIERWVLRNCDKIIVLSNYSKTFLMDTYKIKEDKIEIIPGGVDVNLFKPGEDKITLRQQLKLPEEKIILITTRRLIVRMGIENLIYAMKDIVKSRENILLLIIGEGFLKDKLQRIVTEEDLIGYVKFLGTKDMKELPIYYQAANLFIMPSEQSEWFGLSTLEALASGIPALGTPAGATSEILNDLNPDLIFKGTDILSIKNGICKFIDNYERLEDIRRRTRQYVINNFTWDIVLSKVKKVFLETIKD